MTSKLFLLVVLVFICEPFLGSAQVQHKLEKYLNEVHDNHIIPGFAVIVIKKDSVLFVKGFGREEIDGRKKFTPETVAAIGSLTKSLTAMAIMQLVERNLLELDAPVIKYLPDFATANKNISDWITVRMLLNNTAGLNANPDPSYRPSKESLNYLAQSLKSTFLTKRPGTSYEYSNTDFSIAGLLIQKLTGQSYEDYIQENIFRPLNMDSSSSEPRKSKKSTSIYGHNFGLRPIPANSTVFANSGEYVPAGSMARSTALDLGNYLIALLNEGEFQNRKVVTRNSIDELWKPTISFQGLSKDDGGNGLKYQYGLGWMISKIDGREIIHHGGSTGTMSSFTMIDKENSIATALLFNIDLTFIDKFRYTPHYTIANNILHIVTGNEPSEFGIPRTGDNTKNDFELTREEAKNYIGEYNYSKGGLAWMNFGLKLQVDQNEDNELVATITRGNELTERFILDFVNPSLAVSRNIASPRQIHFTRSSKGGINEVLWSGKSYKKIRETLKETHTVFSAKEGILLHIPKKWVLQHTEKGFMATSGRSLKSKVQVWLKWDQNMKIDVTLSAFINEAIMEKGIVSIENIGVSVWEKQSFKTSKNLIYTVLRQKNIDRPIVLVLQTEPNEHTRQINHVIKPILDDLSILRIEI